MPAILLSKWAPAPIAAHDVLLFIWWPAMWNTLLWAAIGKGVYHLRNRELRSSAVREVPRATAGAYLHPDGFILHAQHRATSGVLLSAPPVIRLPLDTSPAE